MFRSIKIVGYGFYVEFMVDFVDLGVVEGYLVRVVFRGNV